MTSMQPFQGLGFELDFPQSVGVFDNYAAAQEAVDFLSDQRFPVENIAIVGTELRLVERVRGRKDWGTVIQGALSSGVSTGLIVGILLSLFSQGPLWAKMLMALVVSIALSLLFAAIGYSLSKGKRDFVSITQTVPTRFEVLCEHKVAAQARELLAGRPGGRAHLFE
ncbi:YflT domain-containing protein [Mariniluteicoccus flavus]